MVKIFWVCVIETEPKRKKKSFLLLLEMLWNTRRAARYRLWRSNLFTWLITGLSICPIPSILPCRLLSYLSIVSLLHCSPSYLRVPSPFQFACHISPSFPLTPFTCISAPFFFFFYPNLLYPIILQRVKSFPPHPSFPPICHTSASSLLNHYAFVCFVARVSARRR